MGQRLTNLKKDLSIIFSIEEFYKNSKSIILSKAVQGWFFTNSFDNYFMEKKSSRSDINIRKFTLKKDIVHIPIVNKEHSFNARQTIDYLNIEGNIVEKFKKLKGLIKSNNLNLINDSFGHDIDNDIFNVQQNTFNDQGLNIVIIGAGVSGLFLANIIKNTLGREVNVLILDNRSNKKNTRKPFNREWLTHIPSHIVQKYTSPNIKKLVECFGTNGLIGVPINILESILMLSCKDQGVKFYFSPKLDYSKLNSKFISFFFDATGGRLIDCEYFPTNPTEIDIQVPNTVMDFKYTGLNQLHNFPTSKPYHLNIKLKASGAYHFPYIGNSKIYTHMFKVIGIPENLMKEVLDFIKPLNTINLFYAWNGALKDEINEGLVLINLTNKENDLLNSRIYNSMNLKTFLKTNVDILSSLDRNIISFIQMLTTLDINSLIRVEKPFSYLPYINLNAGLGHFNGKRIFPIGDSLFCGHPKVGNGLANHLKFINDLIEKIATVHNENNVKS